MIRSKRDRYYKFYFPMENFLTDCKRFIPGPTKQRVLEVIRSSPGITQREIAKKIGTTPSTALHHLKYLIDMGVIIGVKDGKHIRYFSLE
jgi:DNA-binding MarR family transcriptional regulator